MAFLCLLALVGCSDAPDGQGDDAVAYTHSLAGVPTALDPLRLASTYDTFFAQNLFQTLYRYRYLARPYELVPELAAGLPEVGADGRVYRIVLRDGQHFADHPAFEGGRGREVVAADVAWSLARHLAPGSPSNHGGLWEATIDGVDAWRSAGAAPDTLPDGLRVVDRHVLEVRLGQPQPQFLASLATPYASVVPREVVVAEGDAFARRPIGSGPYRLQAIDEQRARLERNSNYTGWHFDAAAEGARDGDAAFAALDGRSLPLLHTVRVEFVPDSAARWIAYEAGQTDFVRLPDLAVDRVLATHSPPTLDPALQGAHRLVAAQELGLLYLTFNFKASPLSDAAPRGRDLRCAIISAIDWERRNEVLFANLGTRARTLVPASVVGSPRAAGRPGLAAACLRKHRRRSRPPGIRPASRRASTRRHARESLASPQLRFRG